MTRLRLDMSLSDKLAAASLFFGVLTSICAVYLAYAALSHTVRPNIIVRMISPNRIHCGTEALLAFEVVNVGHWYGSPMAVDITVYCDFPGAFTLHELRYGSVQEHKTTEVKSGKGGLQYLKARGIKLSRHSYGEELHVIATAPLEPGVYRARLSAYSANGASFSTDIDIESVLHLDQVVLI